MVGVEFGMIVSILVLMDSRVKTCAESSKRLIIKSVSILVLMDSRVKTVTELQNKENDLLFQSLF